MVLSHVQVRSIFGGGNKNEDSDVQTSSHVSAHASSAEKKEVTKAYAASDVRSLTGCPQLPGCIHSITCWLSAHASCNLQSGLCSAAIVYPFVIARTIVAWF